jgi:TonB-linked SusC/RagA family outer membrane protein
MKKKLKRNQFPDFVGGLSKVTCIMKLTLFLILLNVCVAFSSTYSQQTKFTLSGTNVSIRDVLANVESKSEFRFFFNSALINLDQRVNYHVEEGTIFELLDLILSKNGIQYKIKDRTIILSPNSSNDQNITAQQQHPVSGKVTDPSGSPLPGVTVAVKGTTRGIITDTNGNYSLSNVPGDATLAFSFVGMKTQEIMISGKTTINVVMQEEAIGIEEVVAIAYGTQRRREVTGSVSHVDATELEDFPVGQFAQKIQGRIAGVQINQTTGKPGQGMAFRIRGASSFNAGNQPLYVIDGTPVESLININPDEIESFTVLKDASASAMYGSRAANGVIIITTKQAQKGQSAIEFNAYYGMQYVPQHGRPDVMNGREFAQFEKEYFEDKIRYENWVNPVTHTQEVPQEYQNPEQYGEGTNWYNTLIREAPIQSYSLTVTSGTEKLKSTVIAGYFNQKGVLHNTGYQRYNLRMNTIYQPTSKLTLGFYFAPSYQLEHNTRISTDNTWQIIQAAILSSPLVPFKNPDGSLPVTVTSYNLFPNPNWYRVLIETQDDYKTTHLLGNAYLEYELLKGLKFKTHIDADLRGETRKYFVPSTSVGAVFTAPPQKATGSYSAYNNFTWLSESTLSYKADFHDVHHIDVLVGYSTQKFNQESGVINGTDYPSDDIPWLNVAATITGRSNTTSWSLLSVIGRLNYNYKDKYLLAASIRRDGSSRFGSDKKFGYFPSVSAGWIISDESFMKNVPLLNYAKLRASYGLTGNNNIGNYTYIAGIGTYNYVIANTLAPGKSVSTLENARLSWEKTKQLDLGIDIGLLKDRIIVAYDYYHKLTDDMLYAMPIPKSSGFSSIQSNVGSVKFWGHEISITTRNLTQGIKWTSTVNVSFNKNLVTKLVTPGFFGATAVYDDYWRTQEGYPLGQFFGYVFDGVYMTQEEYDTQPKDVTSLVGTVRMKDVNNDKKITVDDRTFIGDPNPKAIVGMTNDLTYRNFDLNITMSGALGGKMIDGIMPYTENLDAVFNVRKEVANRWRSLENPGKGEIPRTRNTPLARTINSRYVQNGSYLTVKNITLGYNIPMERKAFKSIRIYGSVQQAFVFTAYKGMNPETSIGGLNGWQLGVDKTAYPVPRTFALGINARF